MKNILKYLLLILFVAIVFFLKDVSVEAINYDDVCKESIPSNNGIYKKCSDNYIYLIEEKEHSSHFVSTLEMFTDSQILYAGKIDGIDTFYSMGFHYFGVVYDNQTIGKTDYNYWSDISYNGVVIYDGKFEDIWLVDQSKIIPEVLYAMEGTYLIRQYKGYKITNIIKVIIPNKKDYGIEIVSAKYGDKNISSSNLVGKDEDFVFQIFGGAYGFNNEVDVTVNECNFKISFSKNLIIPNEEFSQCLSYNSNNSISLAISNGFNMEKVFKYSFKLNSNNVSIKFEDSVSAIETSSRRVLIKSYAGMGKNINDEYNLYYWSKSADDKLTYTEFINNYQNSKNKGTYSSSKGVILRDAVGTYYLYAMAKDDDSVIVVRSDEYILKRKDKLNKVVMNDVFFVGVLGVVAIIPIFIYLCIRGKDTD